MLVLVFGAGFGLTQQHLYHAFDLVIYAAEVPVKHDFLVSCTLEGIDFREFLVLSFLMLNLAHVECCLAEILGSLKVCKT